jgi:hypothetical protein
MCTQRSSSRRPTLLSESIAGGTEKLMVEEGVPIQEEGPPITKPTLKCSSFDNTFYSCIDT